MPTIDSSICRVTCIFQWAVHDWSYPGAPCHDWRIIYNRQRRKQKGGGDRARQAAVPGALLSRDVDGEVSVPEGDLPARLLLPLGSSVGFSAQAVAAAPAAPVVVERGWPDVAPLVAEFMGLEIQAVVSA